MASRAEALYELPQTVGEQRTPALAYVVLVALLVCASSVATQVIAWRLRFHPALGRPVLHLGLPYVTALYPPWAWLEWLVRYGNPLAPTQPVPAVYAALWTLPYVLGGGCVVALAGFFVARTLLSKPEKVAELVDSARMATLEDLRRVGLLDAKCGPIVGCFETSPGVFEPLRWGGDIGIEGVGQQGSGKSAAVVKPALLIRDEHEEAPTWSDALRRGHPYGWETLKIVLAVKPDLVESTSGYRASLGENVFVIDPLSSDPHVAKYNPLDLIRIGTPHMFGDCFRFGLAIVDQGMGLSSYWDRTAHEAIAAFIGHGAFVSLIENDSTINSLPWLVRFVSSFADIDKLCEFVLNFEHDPHSGFGWVDEDGKATKTCPWIADAIRALKGKEGPEKSGIYGSFLQFLAMYRDPIVAPNVSSSTFDITALANDAARSSVLYIRMPASDLDRCRPYVRLLFNTFFHELLRNTVTIAGQEMRENLRGVTFLFDEAAQLNRMEDIQRYAGIARGLGAVLHLLWQNRNQIVTTYGQHETISSNLGVHLYFRPETQEEAEYLSKSLGKFSWVLQERNVSGKRVAIVRDHLAEANRVQTRDLFTPYEVKNLPLDEVFIFCRGLQIRARQFRYYENLVLRKRARLAPVTRSSITSNRPYCIEHLERELGPRKLALLLSPAPDRYAQAREAADVLPNRCRVHRSEGHDKETASRLFFVKLWLPNGTRPVLDAVFPSANEREQAIDAMLTTYDENEPKPTEEEAAENRIAIPAGLDAVEGFLIAMDGRGE